MISGQLRRDYLIPLGTLLFVSSVGISLLLSSMQQRGLFYDTKYPVWSFESPRLPIPEGDPGIPLLPTEGGKEDNDEDDDNKTEIKEEEPVHEVKQEEHLPHGRYLTVTVTAYCTCPVCCGIWSEQHPSRIGTDYVQTTYTGTRPTEGRTIAVDPKVIPLGSSVIMDNHTYIAEDIGGAIKGNHIDLYFSTHESACSWGKQTKTIYIID